MNALRRPCTRSVRRACAGMAGVLLLTIGMPALGWQHAHAPATSTSTATATPTCATSGHAHGDVAACREPMKDMQDMPKGMDHGTMPMPQHDDASAQAPPIGSLPTSDGSAPKPYRAYGVTLHMPNDPWLSKFMLDNLEQVHGGDGNAQAWELKSWTGNNLNRVWLRSEGTRSDARIQEGDAELLWGHAVSPFWDLVLGARHDLGTGPARNWAAFGIQGLAPYQFNYESTLYLGPSGRSALRLRASQEWLFTQRLILEPELELNAYGKSDPRREHAAGLADTALSLRLRYEFSRKFAPYVGYSWTHKWADTARMAQRAGTPVTDHELLLGVRVWF